MVTQKNRFCKCIKAVKAKGIGEQQAIAICVKSVLHTKGKTLKRLKCGKKPYIRTQPLKL
jgi:hypothetical protein